MDKKRVYLVVLRVHESRSSSTSILNLTVFKRTVGLEGIGILGPDDEGGANSGLNLIEHDGSRPHGAGKDKEEDPESNDDINVAFNIATDTKMGLEGEVEGDTNTNGTSKRGEDDTSKDNDTSQVIIDDHRETLSLKEIHGVLGSGHEVLAIKSNLSVSILVEVTDEVFNTSKKTDEDASKETAAITTVLSHGLEGLDDSDKEGTEGDGTEGSSDTTLECTRGNTFRSTGLVPPSTDRASTTSVRDTHEGLVGPVDL